MICVIGRAEGDAFLGDGVAQVVFDQSLVVVTASVFELEARPLEV